MSANKYKLRLIVLPEDEANQQIANGFYLNPSIDHRAIDIDNVAGGWLKVLSKFTDEYVPIMRKYSKSLVVLLVDFDQQVNRLESLAHLIPKDLTEKVFVLGALSDPEKLKRALKMSLEEIGKSLAKDCEEKTYETWGHDLLKHNHSELLKMMKSVRPFLFLF